MGKKKTELERLEMLKDRLMDARIDFSMREKSLRRKIVKYYKDGRSAPAAYLVAWRTSHILLTVIDNFLGMIESSIMLQELRNAVSDALGTKQKQLSETLQKINEQMRDISIEISELMGLQKGATAMLSRMNEMLSKGTVTTAAEMDPEIEAMLVKEFIEDLAVSDPETYSAIKDKIGERT